MKSPGFPLLALILAACVAPLTGSEVSSATEDSVTLDSTLSPDDLGIYKLGFVAKIPPASAGQAPEVEYQLAAVVIRDGAFSPKESWMCRMRMRPGDTDAFALLAFNAHGPFRPDADDCLVQCQRLNLSLHFPSRWGPRETWHPGNVLALRNQPFTDIGSMTWGDGNLSTDILHADHVLGAVHLFVHILDVTAATPGFGEDDISRVKSLDQIIPPEHSATAAATP